MILANSRPFELLFCLPAFALLLVRLRGKLATSWRIILTHVFVPMGIVGLLGGSFTGLYNWRVTGNALLMPYAVSERTYEPGTPLFSWQPFNPPVHFVNPQLSYYSGVRQLAASNLDTSFPGVAWGLRKILRVAHAIFLMARSCGARTVLPPGHSAAGGVRFLVVELVFVLAGFILTVWLEPHYFAPLTATVFALVVQCIRYLRL